MKPTQPSSVRQFALAVSLLAGGMFAATGGLRAANLYYDADGTGGGTALNYGSGTWSTAAALWLTGTPGTAGGTYSGWTNSATDVANIGSGTVGGYTAAASPFTITLGGAITVSGLVVSNNLTQSLTISNGGTAANTLTIGTSGINDNQATAGVTATIDAVVAGTSGLLKFNSGTLILTQANTYTGGTTIQGGTTGANAGGTLQVGNGGAAGTLSTGGVTFQLAASQTAASTLSFNRSDAYTAPNNLSVNSANTVGGVIQQAGGNKLTLSGTVSTSTAAAANGAVLTFSIGRTAAVPVDTEVTNVISGTGALTKTGAGVLQFSNANTYSGATTVNAGTLLVNGSTVAASAVGVNNSGTILGGTGTVGGAVTVNTGAILQGGTGAPTGTLTLTSVPTLNTGSVIGLTLGTGNAHSVLGLPAGFNAFQTNQNFTLGGLQAGTYDNVITGVAAGINTTAWTVVNGSGFSYSFTDDGTSIDLTVTAVPEPSTWTAGVLCCAVAVGAWRRRRPAC